MTDMLRTQLLARIDASDLFDEILRLPDARRYLQAFERARVWRLEEGESLVGSADLRGAYVVLEGSITPRDGDSAGRRVFGQWTGLRGEPLDERITAASTTVIMECATDLLQLVLGSVASNFKVEFYAPLLVGLDSIVDAPPEVIEQVARKARFGIYAPDAPIVREGEYGSTMFFILAGRSAVHGAAGQRFVLHRGDFFGEAAILTYQPRSATVVADGPCLVMEVARELVADLRKKSKVFKEREQQSYRQRAMLTQLQRTPFFQDLDRSELESICGIATLESFEPYEPAFFQGDAADAVYIVLNGTFTVVEERDEGPLPIAWVRDGETVGEMSLLPGRDDRARSQTVSALQRVDAIRIPSSEFERIVAAHPSVCDKLETTARRRSEMNVGARESRRAIPLGWMMETQHIAGNAVLAVDMNDCIRCGNCVSACEAVHPDGLSRFHWGAMRQADDVMPHIRFSNSCQHCEYALCMEACPTNAIERESRLGAVFIDYDKCIKCGKCADPKQGCPYGSIYVVPTEQVKLETPVSWFYKLFGRSRRDTDAPDAAATKEGKNYPVKCDLCHGQPHQACVHHCPTGAVFRVDGDRQFADALRHTSSNAPDTNRPSAAPFPMYVRAEFREPAVAGKPASMDLSFHPEGPGHLLHCRLPEQGVSRVTLNTFLVAPEALRIGGGGPLRQHALTVDAPGGAIEYAITSRSPGGMDLTLAVYQGGLYLDRVPIRAEFAAPEKPAAPPAAASPSSAP